MTPRWVEVPQKNKFIYSLLHLFISFL